MPDIKKTQQNSTPEIDESNDFSGYFKKPGSDLKTHTSPASPLQELPARKPIPKNIKNLLVVLILLALAQGVYIFLISRAKNPPLPEGYELTSPSNGPPVITPIQK